MDREDPEAARLRNAMTPKFHALTRLTLRPRWSAFCAALLLSASCGEDTTGGKVSASVQLPKPQKLALSADQNDRLLSVVAAPEGFAYAAGYVATNKDQAMAVVRILADGTLDPTFGDAGVATFNVTKGTDKEVARGIALQADGKVVLAGTAEHDPSASGVLSADTDVAVVRFDANGQVDSSFGDGGVLKLDLGTGLATRSADGPAALTGADVAWGVQVLADGRLLVTAASRAADTDAQDTDLTLVAIDQDGKEDPTFAAQGRLRVDVDGGVESPRQSVQLKDDTIVACGYTQKDGLTQPLLVKFNVEGRLDAAFGEDGVAHPSLLNTAAEAYDVELQGDKLITVGYGKDGADDTVDLVAPRFMPDGQVDETWGEAGLLRVDVAGEDDRGRDLAVLPDGRVLFAGSGKRTAGDIDAMLVVSNKDGAPDAHVGDAGKLLFDLGGVADAFYGVAVSADNRSVFVVGYAGGDAKQGEDDAVVLVVPVAAL
jgi:uncharacterized delta-60 repeat protein